MKKTLIDCDEDVKGLGKNAWSNVGEGISCIIWLSFRFWFDLKEEAIKLPKKQKGTVHIDVNGVGIRVFVGTDQYCHCTITMFHY